MRKRRLSRWSNWAVKSTKKILVFLPPTPQKYIYQTGSFLALVHFGPDFSEACLKQLVFYATGPGGKFFWRITLFLCYLDCSEPLSLQDFVTFFKKIWVLLHWFFCQLFFVFSKKKKIAKVPLFFLSLQRKKQQITQEISHHNRTFFRLLRSSEGSPLLLWYVYYVRGPSKLLHHLHADTPERRVKHRLKLLPS